MTDVFNVKIAIMNVITIVLADVIKSVMRVMVATNVHHVTQRVIDVSLVMELVSQGVMAVRDVTLLVIIVTELVKLMILVRYVMTDVMIIMQLKAR